MEHRTPSPPPFTTNEKRALIAGMVVIPVAASIINPLSLAEMLSCGTLSSITLSVLIAGTPTRTEGSIINDIEITIERIRGPLEDRLVNAMTHLASRLDRTKD